MTRKSWVIAALLLAASIAPSREHDVNRRAVVSDSAGLARSLRDSNVQTVVIQGTVTIDPRDFRTAAVIDGARRLCIQSEFTERGRHATIDFGGTSDVAYVAAGSIWAAKSIRVQGLAVPDARTGLPLAAASAALWPTLRGDPGSSFELVDVAVMFPLPPLERECPAFAAGVRAVLNAAAAAEAAVQPGSAVAAAKAVGGSGATELTVAGRLALQLPVGAYGTELGRITLLIDNSTLVCRGLVLDADDLEDTSGSGLQGAAAALGAAARAVLLQGAQAALLITILSLTAAWWMRTRQRLQAQQDAAKRQAADAATDAAIDLALQLDRRPLRADSRSRALMPRVRMISTAVAVASPQSGGGGSAASGSSSGPSSGANNLSSEKLGSGEVALGDHHGYLLRMRLEGGLEGIELGPVLGKGSFGKVYKGRWRGALVAIKVVEHSSVEGGRADIIEGARESLLAASVSHPNIASCYKIATVAISRSPGSTDADGFPLSSPGGSGGPQRTASLLLPPEVLLPPAAESPLERAPSTGLPPTGRHVSRRVERAGSSGNERAAAVAAAAAAVAGAAAALQGPIFLGASAAADDNVPPGLQLRRRASESNGSGSGTGTGAGTGTETGTGTTSRGDGTETGTSSSDQSTIETWMLLEYADRGNLEEAIQNRRFQRRSDKSQLDMLSVYRTLLDIASGMQYLHSLGLVHGDLKPANALLKSTVTDSRGFVVKLTDFGLARMLDLNKSHLSTKSFGTIPYMPPELLAEGRMSRKCDVFSFGVIAWQILSGQPPHSGMAPMQVLFNTVHNELRPDIPAGAPRPYRELIEDCWAQRPENRPSFDELQQRLMAMLEQERALRAIETRCRAPPPPQQQQQQERQQQCAGAAQSGAGAAAADGEGRAAHAHADPPRPAAGGVPAGAADLGVRLTMASLPLQQPPVPRSPLGPGWTSLRRRSAEAGTTATAELARTRSSSEPNTSMERQRVADAAIAHGRSSSVGDLAKHTSCASESTATISMADSELDAWVSSPLSGALGGGQFGAQGPGGGGGGEAAGDGSRFLRLVKRSMNEGGPLRYSLEMRSGDRHHGGSGRRYRSSSGDRVRTSREGIGGSLRPVSGDSAGGDSAGTSAPRVLNSRRSLDTPTPLSLQQSDGAPPPARSSGTAGVSSPFATSRSWRLREASGTSGGSQEQRQDAAAAACGPATEKAAAERQRAAQASTATPPATSSRTSPEAQEAEVAAPKASGEATAQAGTM